MFVNEGYENYKYFVNASDNFVVLTNKSYVNADYNNPQEINVIYQYFNPSYITIEGKQTIRTSTSYIQVETSNSFWDRPDCSNIMTCIFFIVILSLFIINGLTKFIVKGGIFNAD